MSAVSDGVLSDREVKTSRSRKALEDLYFLTAI